MITSSSNRQVKQVIQLQKKGKIRNEQDCFIVEGLKMAAEVPEDRMIQGYLSASFYEKQGVPVQLEGASFEIVEDKVFAQMSDTKTPQGILCLVRQYHYSLEEMLKKKHPLLLVLEDLQDPGNVGTIFRTAEGAGVDGIIMSKNCVDVYHPKTIRSTMGSVYRMPFLYTDDLDRVFDQMKQAGIRTYAAHLEGHHTYDREDYRGGCAFLIGNEGNGLSEKTTQAADCKIRIPMEGQLESLNAAVAAALLMYEVHRQRSYQGEELPVVPGTTDI